MIESKKIIVLGAGESGIGAALLAKNRGYDVFVSDLKSINESAKKELQENEIPFEEEGHSWEIIQEAAIVIKSPGIPDKAPLIKKLKNKNIAVISEIEWAAKFTTAKIIGITGSNGKTTTTTLTYEILKNAGLDVGVAGNIGNSFARELLKEEKAYYVLELSSFQLDGITEFKPWIAVLLNITADHLDRYEYDMNNYIASKFRISQNQKEEDYFIYNVDDDNMQAFMEKNTIHATPVGFSLTKELEKGAFKKEKNLLFELNAQSLIFDSNALSLKGLHNQYNAMAAINIALLVGLDYYQIAATVNDFQSLTHRLETVATINGIRFINDSKATNVDSVWYALEAMDQPTIWLLGGTDKGNDYNELMELAQQKVKCIIAIGEDNTKIIQAFSEQFEIIEVPDMQTAVQKSYQLAKKNETVLLSPACSSFDRFENYKDRGEQFKKAVKILNH